MTEEEGEKMKRPSEPVSVTLTPEQVDDAVVVAGSRLEVPVSRIEKAFSFETRDGYRIDEYEHFREYPPELALGPIVPGQETEARGWPCPSCRSANTSCWGVTTVPDMAYFECHGCGASGEWNLYCRRQPSLVHIGSSCDCSSNNPVSFGGERS